MKMRVATANYGGSFRRNSEIKASANPATLVVIVYSEALVRGATTSGVAPVAETGFSHRLNVYKIIRLFFGLSYLNISVNNQVENSFFLESVTFQFHARMLSSEVAQSLKSYGYFPDLGVDITLSHRHV